MDMIHIYPQIQLAQIRSLEPNKVFGPISIMSIEKSNISIDRILFKFPILSIPKYCKILKAVLTFYVQSTSTYSYKTIHPYIIKEPWSINCVTFNHQPSFNSQHTYEPIHVSSIGFYTINLTSQVTQWHDKTLCNYGIMLDASKSTPNGGIQMVSTYHSNLSPKLELIYTFDHSSHPSSTRFVEKIQTLTANNKGSFSSTMNTSLTKTITCHIQNLGSVPVAIQFQTSPDGHIFCNDACMPKTVLPNEMISLTPYVFSKYLRIAAKTLNDHNTSSVKIWYQAQI